MYLYHILTRCMLFEVTIVTSVSGVVAMRKIAVTYNHPSGPSLSWSRRGVMNDDEIRRLHAL